MWNSLVAQESVGIFRVETGGIEHHQDFGDQSFNLGFAVLAGDQPCNLRLVLVKEPTKFVENTDSMPYPQSVPAWLSGMSASHSGVYFGLGRGLEFAQDFTRRRIDGCDLPNRY